METLLAPPEAAPIRTEPPGEGRLRTEPAIDERVARDGLRAQIAGLERRVAAISPRFVTGLRRAGAPALLSLGELERVRDDLVTTLRAGEAAGAEEADAQAAARARLNAMLADPAAHRWERVTREELGEPGCGDWHVRPRAGLLGMLAGWWQVKLSSGCP